MAQLLIILPITLLSETLGKCTLSLLQGFIVPKLQKIYNACGQNISLEVEMGIAQILGCNMYIKVSDLISEALNLHKMLKANNTLHARHWISANFSLSRKLM